MSQSLEAGENQLTGVINSPCEVPEDIYFRDITATIATNEELDDIENLQVPSAPPQRNNRPEIVPEPDYQPGSIQHTQHVTEDLTSDPSDTLYGANTNTYTTDDNTSYLNPSLETRNKATVAAAVPQPTQTPCGEDCSCAGPVPTTTPSVKEVTSKSGCGSGDCGCSGQEATAEEEENKESCGEQCGCGDSYEDFSAVPPSSSRRPVATAQSSDNSVQTFSAYGNKPDQSADAPVKASTAGLDYAQGAVSNIPGLGRVYIKTWGCSHNTSDGEYMAGLLQQAGYTVTNNDNDAHIWVLNSCTVKGPSEHNFFNELKRGRDSGKGVVVAGCVPQAHPSHPLLATYSGRKVMSGKQLKKLKRKQIVAQQRRQELAQEGKTDAEIDAIMAEQAEKDASSSSEPTEIDTTTEIQQTDEQSSTVPYAGVVSVLGVDNIHRIVDIVESTLQGNSVSFLHNSIRHRPGTELALPKIRKNPLIEIISISTGCLNNCTYCKTKHARGNLRSYPVDEIVERVTSALNEGAVEIWLTSEDLGAYGIDLGIRVHDLLRAILTVMRPGTMLRMGMSNPPYFKDILNEMAPIFEHPNCYEFLHIPVQAGSDAVLNDMKRDYTNYEFDTICTELIEKVPTLTLATDFICGFPTETDDEFEKSMALIEKFKFPVVFINQYYPRPGTYAYALPQLPAATLKSRSKRMVTLFNSYNTRNDRTGEEWDVIVTDLARDGEYMVGHTKRYDQVLIPAHPQIMGKQVRVTITECFKHYLMAELVPGTVEKANKIPTILPINYKYWSFAQFIDSNLDNFIQSSAETAPTAATTTAAAQPSEPLATVHVTSRTTAANTDVSIDDDVPLLSRRRKEQTPESQPTTTKTETSIATPTNNNTPAAAAPQLIDITKNKSDFASDLIHTLRSIDELSNITDEEMIKYAERAVRGDVPSAEIEPGDLDPKLQLAAGVAIFCIAMLILRQIYF